MGENPSTRFTTHRMLLKKGITIRSMGDRWTAPVSWSAPAVPPCSTTLLNVPLERATMRMLSEKKAATGKDMKLAAASPSAAKRAIQHRMMPRPRAKFRPKLPSRYNTSRPSSRGKSRVVLSRFVKRIMSRPSSSKRFGGTSNSEKLSAATFMGL